MNRHELFLEMKKARIIAPFFDLLKIFL